MKWPLSPLWLEAKLKSIVQIVHEPIDENALSDWVWSPSVGAEVKFLGKVRNHNARKKVTSIEYSAYDEMAVKEMKNIIQKAFKAFPIEKAAFVHRVGSLTIGDVAVAVFVSSSHRKEAFEASQFILNELKKYVPIWKKEFYEDGSEWLGVQCSHAVSS
jgi:molybdopterin synthase catalytic subunit